MDLLLTHGYSLAEDEKEQQIMKPYPPLGLLSISAHLLEKGFGVEVYDSTFGSFDELVGILDSENPATIGIYGTLMTRGPVLRLAQAARQRGWRVVLGGPEPSNYATEYLERGADVIVEGEGELTLEEILGGAPEASTAGIHFMDDAGVAQFTGGRALIPDLDQLPWPARDQIDLGRYLSAWREHHGKGSVSVITARGCPYHCRWCSHSTYGKTHRRRSPEAVAAEVSHIRRQFNPEMLWFADDVFTIHHGWIRNYLRLAQSRDLLLPFECITRADRLNEEMVDALAQLGCFRVWIGSESGSQRLLDSMQRGVTVEQVQTAVELCRSRGIETGMFLMWGYEGEDETDIEATIEHVKRCLPDIYFTTRAYPIKGTDFFDDVSGRIEVPHEWASSSDRELTIEGQRSRAYYQQADTRLRTAVEAARAADTP